MYMGVYEVYFIVWRRYVEDCEDMLNTSCDSIIIREENNWCIWVYMKYISLFGGLWRIVKIC